VRRVDRGDIVFVEGQPAESVSLLAEGRIRVVRETDDGREVILRLIHPGELFGGAGAWGADTYPATTIAVDSATVFVLPAIEFTDLIQTVPGFALAVVRELGDRLRLAESRIQELQTERVERRIARALLRLAGRSGQKTPDGIEIMTPLSRQSLADLCGTTLSTASRTLSAWDRAGILDAGRERVVIKRAHELVAIAEDFSHP
jgi:CRP-like cAMP-binding protein